MIIRIIFRFSRAGYGVGKRDRSENGTGSFIEGAYSSLMTVYNGFRGFPHWLDKRSEATIGTGGSRRSCISAFLAYSAVVRSGQRPAFVAQTPMGTLFRGPCRSWAVARIRRSIQPAGTTCSSDRHLRPGLSCSASNAPCGTPVVLSRQTNDGRHSARALAVNERTAPGRPEPHRPLFDNTKRSIVRDQHLP